MKIRIHRLWELAVIRYVYLTGKGKRSREWKRYVRSEAGRKSWVTRKANTSGLFAQPLKDEPKP